jgi:hypothetical protein
MIPACHKTLIAFTLVTVLTLAACSRRAEPIDPTIPKALQEDPEPSAMEYISSGKGRSYETENLVDRLFNEIQENRPEVAAVVDSHVTLLQRISEIQSKLHETDAKNEEYYSWAKSYANDITDSTKRHEMKAKVEASEAKCRAGFEARNALSARLAKRVTDLKNEMRYLKIRLTLPQIEDYQAKNVPNLGLGEGIAEEQAKLIKEIRAIKTH